MDNKKGYSKRPLWQWILIYVILAIIVYGLIYYFVLAKKGGYSSSQNAQNMYMPESTTTTQGSTAATPSSPTGQTSVTIQNYSFSPSTLTIKAGDTVTWTNQDSVGHSATSDNGDFDTGILDPGKSATHTFSKPGTYTYHCSVHPTMHGTIVVQ